MEHPPPLPTKAKVVSQWRIQELKLYRGAQQYLRQGVWGLPWGPQGPGQSPDGGPGGRASGSSLNFRNFKGLKSSLPRSNFYHISVIINREKLIEWPKIYNFWDWNTSFPLKSSKKSDIVFGLSSENIKKYVLVVSVASFGFVHVIWICHLNSIVEILVSLYSVHATRTDSHQVRYGLWYIADDCIFSLFFSLSLSFFFLAHLSRRLKWAILITFCP
jgi:hypothetical protein